MGARIVDMCIMRERVFLAFNYLAPFYTYHMGEVKEVEEGLLLVMHIMKWLGRKIKPVCPYE